MTGKALGLDLKVNLTNKVAVVTGASRGLGKEFATYLGLCGAKVACVDIVKESLDQTVDELKQKGIDAAGFVADVSDASQVEKTVEECCSHFGTIHILINNAGITRDSFLLRMKEEDWDKVISINLKGTFLFTKVVSKVMLKNKWGRIVSIASVCGLIGNPGQANYSASKAGIMGFTRTVAQELGSRNITVNAIAPGFIKTDMTAKLPDDVKASMEAQTALKRFGEVKDVANALLFLVSDAASFITGQTITVDGGLTT